MIVLSRTHSEKRESAMECNVAVTGKYTEQLTLTVKRLNLASEETVPMLFWWIRNSETKNCKCDNNPLGLGDCPYSRRSSCYSHQSSSHPRRTPPVLDSCIVMIVILPSFAKNGHLLNTVVRQWSAGCGVPGPE